METMTKRTAFDAELSERDDMRLLRERLGVVETLKYLEQFDGGGYGDYTKEKYLVEEKNVTPEEILAMFSCQ